MTFPLTPMHTHLPDTDALYAALDALHLEPGAPGAAIAIAAGDRTTVAATDAAAPDGRAMTAQTPVRLASLTKTFTAAAILRLWEAGRLDLDTPISGLMAPELDRLMQDGGYKTGGISSVMETSCLMIEKVPIVSQVGQIA